MKYQITTLVFLFLTSSAQSATMIHLSGTKTTTYQIGIESAADSTNTDNGNNYFSTRMNTRVRGGNSPFVSSQLGSSLVTTDYRTMPRGTYIAGYNYDSPKLGFIFQSKNPSNSYFGVSSFWVTYSGENSDAGLESQCMTNNKPRTYMRITNNVVTCGLENHLPRVNVGHYSMSVNYANTWSGLYELSLTLNRGETKKVLWGTGGNTIANISSTLSGTGKDDIELKGQCNGQISTTGECSVTMKNVSWYGTKDAMLRINISLP